MPYHEYVMIWFISRNCNTLNRSSLAKTSHDQMLCVNEDDELDTCRFTRQGDHNEDESEIG